MNQDIQDEHIWQERENLSIPVWNYSQPEINVNRAWQQYVGLSKMQICLKPGLDTVAVSDTGNRPGHETNLRLSYFCPQFPWWASWM